MSISGKAYIKENPGFVGSRYDGDKPYFRGVERSIKRIEAEFAKFAFCIESLEKSMITPTQHYLYTQLKENQVQMMTYLNESKRTLTKLEDAEVKK
jgi:hypothetical protein